MTKGHDVVNVAHLGRRPNAHQQSALDWLFPVCAAEGCGPGRPTWRPTTAWSGPRAVPPCSACWTGCASSTTTARPTKAGPWSTGGARGRSCPPMTPATLVILVTLVTRRKPWRRLRPERNSVRGSRRKLTVPFDGDFERGLFALVEHLVRPGFQR